MAASWDDFLSKGVDAEPDEDFLELAFEAVLPSGAVMKVATEAEKVELEKLSTEIMNQHKFSNPLDLEDVDNIVRLGVLAKKYQELLLNPPLDEGFSEDRTQKRLSDCIDTSSKLKKALGIDRVTREAGRNEDLGTYIDKLLSRAQEFGIRRNEEAAAAIEWLQDVIAKAQVWNNATPDERNVLNVNGDDILLYILETMEPAFKKIDNTFRKEKQRFWIEDQ